MIIFDRIFSFYVNSSIHVALAVISLTLITFLEFNIAIDVSLLLFIFISTITGYNFVKYAGVAKLNHLSLAKDLRIIQIFSLFCFIILVFLTFQQKFEILLLCGILGGLTMLYAIPIFSGNRNLRSLTGVKIYIIALVWAGVSVLVPALKNVEISVFDISISFIQRFLFVIAITLPFEIRDLRFDMAQLGTIPQKIGIRKTRFLGIFVMVSIVLLDFFKNQNSLAEVVTIIIIASLASYLIGKAGIRQKKYYSSFWVEAVPIFWLLILIIFRQIL